MIEKTKPRILCIEDDEDSCEMLTFALQPSGYEVVSAHTSEEGFSKVMTDSFDAILMDSYFSDGSGVELCRKIRSFNSRIPIIFYSGEARPERIEQALKAGAQDYLIKPLDPYEVEKTIKRLLT